MGCRQAHYILRLINPGLSSKVLKEVSLCRGPGILADFAILVIFKRSGNKTSVNATVKAMQTHFLHSCEVFCDDVISLMQWIVCTHCILTC